MTMKEGHRVARRTLFSAWALAAVFLTCGGVCLVRAHAMEAERAPWSLIGLGLVLYAAGSVVYNVELTSGAENDFPSRADTLWLPLYALSFAGWWAWCGRATCTSTPASGSMR